MRDFWSRYRRNKGAVIGLFVFMLVVAVGALAPLVYPSSPWSMVARPFLPPMTDGMVLGTDTLGRDIASGVFHGARISVMIGLVSTAVALLIGVTIGACAGYFGGVVEGTLMRITEFFQTIPSFALAIVLVAIFQPSIYSIVFAISVVSWPPVARIVRSEMLTLRTREFVQAAILQGQSTRSIILKQMLPNAMSSIVVMSSLMVASAILLESSLSFLGLGDPNVMSWGYMIGSTRTVLRQAWWMSFFPGVAIMITVLAFNLIGEGLSDALNPRLNKKGAGK